MHRGEPRRIALWFRSALSRRVCGQVAPKSVTGGGRQPGAIGSTAALGPRQKNDAIVQALNSPSLTASLRFPLDPKEETWRPTSQRAAFGLVLRSCPQSRGLGFRRMNAPAFRSAARPGSRRAFQRSHAWITCGQTSGVTGTSAAPAVPASRRPSAEPTWISIGGSPLKSA